MKLKQWLIIMLAFFCLNGFSGCHSSGKESDCLIRFVKANTAYKSGDYDTAIKLYREITDAGFVSAAVDYNLGNCLIKKNQLGQALVWYERALRLAPRDGDLRANWQYARSLIKNPELNAPRRWADRLFVHLPYITDDEIVAIICFLLFAVSLLVLAGLFLRWRFRKTFVLVLLLLVLLVFHVAAFLFKKESLADRAILVSTVDVKYEPEEQATTHFTGYEGWNVRVIRESGGWVKIERPDGLQGWVSRDKLERI